MCRGFALVGLGRREEGIALLRAGLADWTGIGARLMGPQWLGFIADAHIQTRQFDDALTALDRATEVAAATGECHYQAELYRLRGAVLAQTGEEAEAALWLQRAIDTAGSQQAKSLELRAATGRNARRRPSGKRSNRSTLSDGSRRALLRCRRGSTRRTG